VWRLTLPEIRLLLERFLKREERENYRAAMVVSSIYNAVLAFSGEKKHVTPDDILGRGGGERESQSADEMEAALRAWAAMQGGSK